MMHPLSDDNDLANASIRLHSAIQGTFASQCYQLNHLLVNWRLPACWHRTVTRIDSSCAGPLGREPRPEEIFLSPTNQVIFNMQKMTEMVRAEKNNLSLPITRSLPSTRPAEMSS